MASRVIRDEHDRGMALQWLSAMKMPFTLDAVKGAKRSTEQNRLQRLWINEVAEQLGDRTAEEVRAFCKLTMGVPILRAESLVFAEKYDVIVKPMAYEVKLDLMSEPINIPVTRIMTTDQKSRYLDAMYAFWTDKGVKLTEPL